MLGEGNFRYRREIFRLGEIAFSEERNISTPLPTNALFAFREDGKFLVLKFRTMLLLVQW